MPLVSWLHTAQVPQPSGQTEPWTWFVYVLALAVVALFAIIISDKKNTEKARDTAVSGLAKQSEAVAALTAAVEDVKEIARDLVQEERTKTRAIENLARDIADLRTTGGFPTR